MENPSPIPHLCVINNSTMTQDNNNNQILGLHHITAIAGDAQRNYDFYTRVLGLRLIKKTVNFDDPGTYHILFRK